MKKKVLVSIIIPVYNVAPYLVEALESVINQTYEYIEIIIINDGSNDGSDIICDKYAQKDNRIKVVHQKNKGLSAARNVGLDIKSGEVVAFMDPDDKLHPDYIRIMISKMLKLNADIVICKNSKYYTTHKMNFNKVKKIEPAVKEGVYNKINALRFLADGLINMNVWNKIYRAELWNDIRFPEGYVYEDVATTYKIFNCSNTICVVDEILYMRRIRPQSITSMHILKNRKDFVKSLFQFELFIKKNIPDIFDENHLRRIRRLRLYQLIICYVLFSYESHSINLYYYQKLRKKIIRLKSEVGINDANIFRKMTYYMICYFPFVLNLVILFFYLLNKLKNFLLRYIKI